MRLRISNGLAVVNFAKRAVLDNSGNKSAGSTGMPDRHKPIPQQTGME